jgi:molybdopterin converting factor small subunit
MQPFTERSPEAGDQPDANVYSNVRSNVRMTVQEAAAALGITVEAVRGRMHRGKYGREKAEDGRVYVVLTPDQLANVGERSDERSEAARPPAAEHSEERSAHVRQLAGGSGELVEELRDHVAFLRAELEARNKEIQRREEEHREEARRKDTIIAQLAQRIPELEAPRESSPEAREASETVSEESDKGTGTPEQQEPSPRRERSWWREFFGLD